MSITLMELYILGQSLKMNYKSLCSSEGSDSSQPTLLLVLLCSSQFPLAAPGGVVMNE